MLKIAPDPPHNPHSLEDALMMAAEETVFTVGKTTFQVEPGGGSQSVSIGQTSNQLLDLTRS